MRVRMYVDVCIRVPVFVCISVQSSDPNCALSLLFFKLVCSVLGLIHLCSVNIHTY